MLLFVGFSMSKKRRVTQVPEDPKATVIDQLWIIVSKDGLDSFKTLNAATEKFDDLAQFVVDKGQIVCLKYSELTNPKKDEGKFKWEIEEESLENIAQAFLKRKEAKK